VVHWDPCDQHHGADAFQITGGMGIGLQYIVNPHWCGTIDVLTVWELHQSDMTTVVVWE